MKWFKRILMLIVALVMVAILAAVAFVATFDPNDYKQRIAQVVKEKTGRTVHFNGDISLTIFPWLGVTVKDVSLSNAAGFAQENMVSAGEVEAKAAFLPLLKGQFEIGKLVLDNAVINLERKANGKTNWDDLAAAGGKPTAGKQAPTGKAGATAKPLALAVGGVDIQDGTINWRDDLAKQYVALQKLQVQTGALTFDKPVDLHAGFDYDLTLPGQKPRKGSLALDGVVKIGDEMKSLQASDVKLEVKAESAGDNGTKTAGTGLPQQVEIHFTTPSVKVSLADHSASLPAFTLKAKASKLGGLSYVDAQLGGDVEANWGKGQYASKKLSVKGTVKGLPTHTGTLTVDGSGAVRADLPKGTAELTGWRLASDPVVVKTSLKVSGIGKALSASGPVNIEKFNPRDLAKAMNYHVPPMQSDKAMTRFDMSSQLAVTPDKAMLDDLTVNLDGHKFTGKAGLSDLKHQRIMLRLQGGDFDLNPYLPPESKKAPASSSASGGQTGGGSKDVVIPLPVKALRALNLDAQVQLSRLSYRDYVLTKPIVKMTAAGGQIKLDKLAFAAFGGQLDSHGALDVRGSVPDWRLGMTTDKVQLQPLLKAVMHEDRLIGTGNLGLDLSAQGDRLSKLKSTLDGNAKFALKNGKIKGVDLGYLLRSAQAKLQGGTASVPKEAATDFSSITGTAKIRNGIVHNDDLRGASPLLRVEGKGTVDLGRSTLNYLLTTIVVNTTTGQEGKALDQLKQVPIPVRITGTFANPHYGVDLESVLKSKAKQKAKEQINKQIQKNLGDKAAPVQNLLKGLGF